ncbi:hypothetical protein JSY36_12020 [Bacillus sp. H-16]|nr:hypothetical protein [Alteribacter salitolerans]MBM7096473.1 hypothetical protein [Alteribacter salitolerans]
MKTFNQYQAVVSVEAAFLVQSQKDESYIQVPAALAVFVFVFCMFTQPL